MSRSQALSPHPAAGTRFTYDTKLDLDVDPYASHRHTPDFESDSDEETGGHVTSPPNGHSTAPEGIVTSGEPILAALNRTPRVRFRSRVRISAGMGRRRRSEGFSSTASSISGSPSSSISAPLRTHYTGNNGWGPLGSRVNLSVSHGAALTPPSRVTHEHGRKRYASRNGNGKGNALTWSARSLQVFLDDDDDEHTYLITSAAQHSYGARNQHAHGWYHDDREQELWRRERLVDEEFGKWPGRLLNRHWWWWHLRPILCCFCDDGRE